MSAKSRLPQRRAHASPYSWYYAALLPIGLGYFMYAMEATEWRRLRLVDPVPAMGEFAQAECITHTRGRRENYLIVSYAFRASVYANDPVDVMARKEAVFTARQETLFPSRADCDAALPAVQRARASHPVWYERSQPHMSKATLAEPDSRRFLWVCLGAIPLVLVGALLHWRRRHRR
jgi:hypothetical protein